MNRSVLWTAVVVMCLGLGLGLSHFVAGAGAGDKDLQAKVKAMMDSGVKIQACKACADLYGVAPALAALGIEVKYLGKPLTEILQSDNWETMTF